MGIRCWGLTEASVISVCRMRIGQAAALRTPFPPEAAEVSMPERTGQDLAPNEESHIGRAIRLDDTACPRSGNRMGAERSGQPEWTKSSSARSRPRRLGWLRATARSHGAGVRNPPGIPDPAAPGLPGVDRDHGRRRLDAGPVASCALPSRPLDDIAPGSPSRAARRCLGCDGDTAVSAAGWPSWRPA